MKTISTLLLLAVFTAGALAQNPPATSGTTTNRDELLRRALDRAYEDDAAKFPAATNKAARPARPVRATLPPGVLTPLTNGTAKASEATTVPTNTLPPAVIPAAKPAASPAAAVSSVKTNAPEAATPVPPVIKVPAVTALAPPPPTAATNAAAATDAPATNVPAILVANTNAPASAAVATNAAAPAKPKPLVPPATASRPGATNLATTAKTNAATARTTSTNATDKAADNMTLKPADDIIPAGEIRFKETDLLQVLEVYQELTGRTVLRPSSLPATKVSITTQSPLTRKEAIAALDSIFSLNGITMVPQGEKFVKALTSAQAPQAGMVFYNADPADLPEAGQYISYIAKLQYADPGDIVPAIQPFGSPVPNSIIALKNTQTLLLRDYAENIKRMLEVIREMDVAIPREFEPVILPIKYALASDIAQVLSSLTAGGGGVTSVGQSRQGPTSGLSTPGGTRTSGFGAQGSVGGIPGQPGYGGAGGVGGNTLGGAGGAAGSRGSFSQRLQSIVNRAGAAGDIVILGQTKIIADERTNALLIFASKEDIETIKDIIEKLDVVLAQVLIEAIVLSVKLEDSVRVGVSYLNNPKTSGKFTGSGAVNNGQPLTGVGGFGTNGFADGLTYFGKWGGDWNATLTAIASDSRFNVIQRPRIQTSHAVPCRIFVGESRPYITGTYGGFGGVSQSQVAQLRIGVDLSVLPLINPDGLVVMDIEQRIDDFAGTVRIDNNDVPRTTERSANAKVAVRDRETIMLGGFIQNDQNKTKSGVPYLKDIPVLGFFFRGTSNTRNRTELMVMIRPTVLPTPEDAAAMAADEKSRMPGITTAERDFSKEEKKRQAQSQKDMLKREGLLQ